VVAYEASGNGFILSDELRAAGLTCHVLAPTKIERSTKQKRNKNDDRDADRLLEILRGHYLAGNRLPSVWVPDVQTRDDRETVRTRQDMSQKATAVKTQIQMLLKRNGEEKPEGIGKGWSKGYRLWLKGMAESGAERVGMKTALGSLLRRLEFFGKRDRPAGPGHAAAVGQSTLETDYRSINEGKGGGAEYSVKVRHRYRRLFTFPARPANRRLLRFSAIEPGKR